MSIVLSADPDELDELRLNMPGPVLVTETFPALSRALAEDPTQDLVVIGAAADMAVVMELANRLRVERPVLGVILVRRRVDATVLADAMRSGVREVVKSADPAGLMEACNRSAGISRQLRHGAGDSFQQAAKRAQVVTVFSAKGGCGKTTVSTNLAIALASRQHKVCLVDLDLASGDVGIALQMFPERTIADAVNLTGSLDETAVASLITTHASGVDIIAAPLEPGGAELIPAGMIAGLLDLLGSLYDFVVIDTAPSFNDHVLTAFDASDVQVLLATLDVPALKNLKITLETMESLNYPPDQWRILLNRSDAKVGLTVRDVEKTLGRSVAVQVPSSRDVPASINRGVPIVSESPKHPVSMAIFALADELSPLPAPAAAPSRAGHRREGSLLRRRSVTT